ncbi:Ribonuclease HI [Diplonema papillatum]|nr:Ribonuclease HI [Diplonema papillatum]
MVHALGHRHQLSDRIQKRRQGAIANLQRVKKIPVPVAARETLATMTAGAKMYYGVSIMSLNHRTITVVRQAFMSALWTGPSRRAVEVVMQVLHHGHRLDPYSAPAYIRVKTWIRQMQKWQCIRRLSEAAWTRREALPDGSPHRLVQDALDQAGWSWATPLTVEYTNEIGKQVVYRVSGATEKQTAIVLHDLRQALRRQQIAKMCSRREDLRGCAHGIDGSVTRNLLEEPDSGITGYQQGMLRSIIAGAVETTGRTGRSGSCPYCDKNERETVAHLWWECEAWKDVREEHSMCSVDRTTWPNCLSLCGVAPLYRHDADPAQQPIPLDYKEACRFVGDLQRFYLAVLRARQIKDDREQETSRHHRLSLYPWGWKTPSPRRVSMPVIEAEAIAQQWKHGSQLWKAVHWWIRRLRWAHIGSEHTVTFVELAVDFELTTGVLLPEATNRRIQPPTASGAKPTTARAVLAQHEVVAGLCMYFDGGSRQNGTALAVAGAGAVVYKDGEKIAEARVPLGRATNNVAEYNGLIAGIRLLSEQPPDVEGHVTVRGDSKVVIGTVQGTAMCKPNLRPYYLQATANMADLSPRFDFELEHVPRASNVDADALSNAAMDMVHAETNAQEGTIRAQYNDYRSSALAKSLSLRAITGAATRICGMTWHYGHVTNVTSLTALGGGVMQGISCRAELAPQTETVLRKMAQQVPSTSHRSNPFVKAHEAWAASMHPEQLYDATWKETAEWKGREQERGASGQRSRRPPTARRPSNAAIKCEKHDARRCATCKKRRLPPDTCCNQQHTGHEAGSLNQSRLQFRTARDHREQPAGPSAVT